MSRDYSMKSIVYISPTKKTRKIVSRFLWITILSLFKLANSNAQSIEAISIISSDTIQIGQQLRYQLRLSAPDDFHVNWPVFADTLSSSIEIIAQEEPTHTTDESGALTVWEQQLIITSFDTGNLIVPPVAIELTGANDSITLTIETEPLLIRVTTVDIDPDASFKPIKGIEEMPITFSELLPWLIGILFIAAVLFAIVWVYLRHRNRKTAPEAIPLPNIPPHLMAIEKLETLRLQKLWQTGKTKEYFTELSDIIREYIELQFPVNAVEMTTPEILQGLEPIQINPDAIHKLSATLELADLVKFAKAQPSALENDISLNHLIDFVHESYATALNGETKKEVQI